MNKLINWFDELTLREQMLVGIGAPLALSLLLYVVAIEPFKKQRQKIQQRISTANTQLEEMATIAGKLQFVEKRQDVNEIFGADLHSGNGNRLKSKPMSEKKAKLLFLRLAQQGSASITRTKDGGWQVWFEN